MTGIAKKILVCLWCLCFAQLGTPPGLQAARLAGEETPAPTVSPQRPGSIVPPLKRQERKDQPAPSSQKETSGQTRAKPAEVKEKVAPAAQPVGTAPTGPSPTEVPVAAPAKTPTGAVTPPPASGAVPAPAAKTTGEASPPPPVKPPVPASPPASPDTKKPPETRYVTIDFDNVDLAIFVKFVSELTGKNFVIDEKVKARVTVISPRRISVDEVYKVFESVLEVYGFTTVTSGEVVKIVPALQGREKMLETRVGPEEIVPEDKLVTQIISLEYASPDDVKRVLDPLISRSSVILAYPPTGMLVIADYLSNIKKIMEIIGALDVEGVAAEITYLPLKAASAAEIVKSLSPLFQVQAQAAQVGRPAVAPVRMVADDRANAVILVASEMDTGRVKKLISLMDKDVPRGAATLRVYRLQNAVAEDLAKVLMSIPRAPATPVGAPAPAPVPAVPTAGRSPMLSKDVQILADKATNTLIITANQDDYRVLEEVIKSLDVARPMVFIEALVMEVSTTKDFRIGVEWRGLMDTGSVPGFSTGRTAAFVGSSGGGIIPGTSINTATGTGSLAAFPEGFSLGIIGAGISIGSGTSTVFFPNIGAVVQAFRKDSDVSILSTPQIMTIDNEEAEIKVVENVPYITRQDTSVTVPGQTLGQSFEYRDVGVTLNITPHINEEDFVRLKLSQKVNQVVSGSDPLRPTTLNREAKTTVVVKDKETIVIGGLLKDNTDTSLFGVPCLSNIPIFGWLFKSEQRSRDKTNLFVFITPHIVRTQKDAAELYKDRRDQMGEVVEGVIKLREKVPPKGGPAE